MLKLTIKQQKELYKYINYYNNLDNLTVKSYLREHIKASDIKIGRIAKEINVSIHTLYSIMKTTGQHYKPEFIIYLAICNYLNIPITAITVDSTENHES